MATTQLAIYAMNYSDGRQIEPMDLQTLSSSEFGVVKPSRYIMTTMVNKKKISDFKIQDCRSKGDSDAICSN